MNIRDYLKNPGGKGNAAFGQGTLVDSLDRKYGVLLSGKKKFQHYIYKVSLKEIYYIHIVVPSESDRDNTYDIVIQFTDVDGTYKGANSILDYEVRFFCNAPSFVYTFARAYRVNELFVEELGSKLPQQSLKKDAEVRNQYGVVNYEKYIYFASRYLYDSGLLTKAKLNFAVRPYSKQALAGKVRNFDTVMRDYKIAERKAKAAKNTKVPKKVRPKVQKFDASTVESPTVAKKKPVKPVSKKKPIKKK